MVARATGQPCIEPRRTDPDAPRRWVEVQAGVGQDDCVQLAFGATHEADAVTSALPASFPEVDAWASRKAHEWGYADILPRSRVPAHGVWRLLTRR